MIYDHKNSVVFVHGIKTAGTSIRSAMLQAIGKGPAVLSRCLAKLRVSHPRAALWKGQCEPHMNFIKATELVKQNNIRPLFTFGVLRDPESWAVSVYQHWRRNFYIGREREWGVRISSFRDFFELWIQYYRPSQLYQFLQPDGKIGVSTLYDFSKINICWEALQDRFSYADLPIKNAAPHIKNSEFVISEDDRLLIREVLSTDREVYRVVEVAGYASAVEVNSVDLSQVSTEFLRIGGADYDPWNFWLGRGNP